MSLQSDNSTITQRFFTRSKKVAESVHGRIYGWSKDTQTIPKDGLAYIVEYKNKEDKTGRVVAYIDSFARVFATSELIIKPPLKGLLFSFKPDSELNIDRLHPVGTSGDVLSFYGKTLAHYSYNLEKKVYTITSTRDQSIQDDKKGKSLDCASLMEACTLVYAILLPEAVSFTVSKIEELEYTKDLNQYTLVKRFLYTHNLSQEIQAFFDELEEKEKLHKENEKYPAPHPLELFLARLLKEAGGAYPVIPGSELIKPESDFSDLFENATATVFTSSGRAIDISNATPQNVLELLNKIAPDVAADVQKTASTPTKKLKELENKLVSVESPDNLKLIQLSSNMVYAHSPKPLSPHLTLWAEKIESAFNRFLLAASKANVHSTTEKDLSTFDFYVIENIAQAAKITAKPATNPDQDWDVRLAIARMFENIMLPFRIHMQYRLNLEEGVCALEFSAPPTDFLPRSRFMPTEGAWRVTSKTERTQLVSTYVLNLALVLAYNIFKTSKNIETIVMSCIPSTQVKKSALFYTEFARNDVINNYPPKTNNVLKYFKEDTSKYELLYDTLQPFEKTFDIDDDKYTNMWRTALFDPTTKVPKTAQEPLGATTINDLLITENTNKAAASLELTQDLGGTTKDKVRALLELKHDRDSVEISEAAEKTIKRILSSDDETLSTWEIKKQFLSSADVSSALSKAVILYRMGNNTDALDLISDALNEVHEKYNITDDSKRVYRHFSNFTERILYNKIYAADNREVILLPDSYFEAMILYSNALADDGQHDLAETIARDTLSLNPLNMAPVMRLVRLLDERDAYEEAAIVIERALQVAYAPADISALYYRMAYMQWHLEKPELAEACYLKSMDKFSPFYEQAVKELARLRQIGSIPSKQMPLAEVDVKLKEAGISLAPTSRIWDNLVKAAQAASQVGLLRIASELTYFIGQITSNDMLYLALTSYGIYAHEEIESHYEQK